MLMSRAKHEQEPHKPRSPTNSSQTFQRTKYLNLKLTTPKKTETKKNKKDMIRS